MIKLIFEARIARSIDSSLRCGVVAICFSYYLSQAASAQRGAPLVDRKEYLQKMTVEANETWRKVRILANARELINARIALSVQDTPLGFAAKRGDFPSVEVTYGGLKALDRIASAYALVTTRGGPLDIQAGKQLSEYFCYVGWARRNDLSPISSVDAFGMDINKLPDEYFKQWDFYRKNALFYVLSHEAGHLVAKDQNEALDYENYSETSKRIIKQEIAADKFAVELMLKDDDGPAAFTMVALATVLGFDKPENAPAKFDEINRIRITTVTKTMLANIDKGWMAEQPRFRDNIKGALLRIQELMTKEEFDRTIADREAMLKLGRFPNLSVKNK